LRTFIVTNSIDAVYDVNDCFGCNKESSFFCDFALAAFSERLAQLNKTAGDGPLSLARLGVTAYQKHTAGFVYNDCADAYQRTYRELALCHAVNS